MKIEIKTLNVMRISKLLIAGSRWLSKYADVLNDLNVYPVPDGDTGTNMSMTLQAVENELVKLNYEPEMRELSEIVSEAILLGARGNSGTILSQIMQGFFNAIKDKNEIKIDDVTEAFKSAKEKAYQAVSEPVEGTILTVIRKVAESAEQYTGDKEDFILYLAHLKSAAKLAVEDTPNLLPKLKEAGVVDAGGQGIYYILEGFEKSVTDPEMFKDLERIIKSQATRKERMENTHYSEENIKFRYCTEFIIENGKFDLERYKEIIAELGDSMVCAQTSKKTKTHIHTNNPGQILEIALKHGELNRIKIENMAFQHQNLLMEEINAENDERFIVNSKLNQGEIGYYAIVDNEELGNTFINAGASVVLLGGQTKNPSVLDIEDGIKKLKQDKIILLPNNKNIIASAKIVAKRSNKEVLVLETTSMLEGYYLVKNKDMRLEENLENMKYNISIEVTQAVRDTKVENIEINVGDYIALVNGKIKEKDKNLVELIKNLKEKYIVENTVAVTISYGKDSNEQANNILRSVGNAYKTDIMSMQENYHYYIYIENKNPNLAEVAIVTDSTADLSQELIGDLDVKIIPLKINLGDKYYKDGVDISKGEFWKRIVSDGVIPKTSQPSPAEFKELYEKLFRKGYKKIISIHISSKISGTQQAAKVAKGMVENGENITIVDSKALTMALGYQVLEAAKMVNTGKSVEEIVEKLYKIQDKQKLFFVVDDVSYIEKGGRISKMSSMIGGLLKVKPILKLENGEITVHGKTFGDSGAVSAMSKIIKSEGKKNSLILYTGWGGTQKEFTTAEELKKEQTNNTRIEYRGRFEIGATIGSHSGPVYGFYIMPKLF